MRYTTLTLFIGSLLLSIFSCHKNDSDSISDEDIIDIDSGKFLAIIDMIIPRKRVQRFHRKRVQKFHVKDNNPL